MGGPSSDQRELNTGIPYLHFKLEGLFFVVKNSTAGGLNMQGQPKERIFCGPFVQDFPEIWEF